MSFKQYLLLLVLLFPATHAVPQIMDFPFVDEALQDDEFMRFRSKFIEAVENNDLTFILENTTDDVLNGFGGSGGKEEMQSMWQEIQPDLLNVLNKGGHFSDDSSLADGMEAEFIAPYTYALNMNNFAEEIEWIGIITEDSAAVFTEPGALLLTRLGRVLVWVNDWYPPVNPDLMNPEWVELELANGDRGYVAATQIYSPVDFRCFFEKVNGRWFYAGWAAGV